MNPILTIGTVGYLCPGVALDLEPVAVEGDIFTQTPWHPNETPRLFAGASRFGAGRIGIGKSAGKKIIQEDDRLWSFRRIEDDEALFRSAVCVGRDADFLPPAEWDELFPLINNNAKDLKSLGLAVNADCVSVLPCHDLIGAIRNRMAEGLGMLGCSLWYQANTLRNGDRVVTLSWRECDKLLYQMRGTMRAVFRNEETLAQLLAYLSYDTLDDLWNGGEDHHREVVHAEPLVGFLMTYIGD